jgi:hypothetical protein
VALCLSEEREGASRPKQEIRSKAPSPAPAYSSSRQRDTNGELAHPRYPRYEMERVQYSESHALTRCGSGGRAGLRRCR